MSELNRYALVTGSSQGLGKEIARKLLENGMSVMICARSKDELESAQQELSANCDRNQKVASTICDVSNPADVDRLVTKTLTVFPHLDAIVNNAGVYGPMGPIEDVDWEDWMDAIKINIFGTVYPSRAVIPHFRARGSGRIINLSGGGATSPLPRISAYAASKAAVVRFTETIAEELKDTGIIANAVAPGALNTRLMQQLLDAGPEVVGQEFYSRMSKVAAKHATPLEVGASLCAYLILTNDITITGRLISAVWDPWKDFKKYASEISASDVYTLRRIIPSERGMTWGDD
jgi:3-oxoacyl-[acyl-carrier protein] reductase